MIKSEFIRALERRSVIAAVRDAQDVRRAADSPASAVFLLGGSIAIYSYFLRFWIKRQVKADLVYGLTNQRRLFIRDDGDKRLFVYEGDQLDDAHITELDRHGAGTIYIVPTGARNLLDNTGFEFLSTPDATRHALFDIPDCERVLDLILNEDA